MKTIMNRTNRTNRKINSKAVLALLLVTVIVLSMLPIYAAADNAGIVEMSAFLGEAKGLQYGEAIANKVVTENPPNSGIFDIELYVAGKNGVPKAYGTDIVFVIDTSGSMSDNDINNARQSVIYAIDALFADPEVGNKSRVAIVAFNENATIGNFEQGSGTRYWTNKDKWEQDTTRVSSTSSGRLSSGNFWSKNNRTNTQAGIHAGHYLLQNPNKPAPPSSNLPGEDAYDGSKNTMVMVVMTDGGPNKYYNPPYNTSPNTTTFTYDGATRRIIDPTVAPFTNNTTIWVTTNEADGNENAASRAIWQAKYAQDAGIAMYAIGYGNYFSTNSNGDLTGSSVARTTLEGIAPRFFTAASGGAAKALTDIMSGISRIAAARLNNLLVTDLIGDGFILHGSLGIVQKAGFTQTSALDDLIWANVTDEEAVTNYAITQNDVNLIWNLGAVDDFTMYRMKFQVSIKNNLPDGTYYTNTNTATQFSQAEPGQRSHQTGQHNKLTYSFDGKGESCIIYACEKYTVSSIVYHKVTVNYHVFDKSKGEYVREGTESDGTFVTGDPYTSYAQNLFCSSYGQDSAPFSHASISVKSDIALNESQYYDLVNGQINNADVVIDLYYIGAADIDIWLTKSISLKESGMNYPSSYSFTFYLDNGSKDVAKLVFTQADFASGASSNKKFLWLDGVSYQSDLEGKTLYIREECDGNWTSDLANSTPYASIMNGIVVFPGQQTTGIQVANEYCQDPVPATVHLEKSFEGDLANMVNQGHDGSVLDCSVGSHVHNEDCYVYNFDFTLKDKDGNVVDSDSLSLTKSEIMNLVNDPATTTSLAATWTSLDFNIPASKVKDGPFYISESSPSGAYWSLGAQVAGIIVDPYTGNVTYPGGTNAAEMTNTFEGTSRPDLAFSKQVIDARSGAVAWGYNGKFHFELFDGSSSIGTYTIDVNGGQGTVDEIIKLYDYINANATLSLKEIVPDPSNGDFVAGMTYDEGPYFIEIVNGVVVSSPIVFENVYMEPIEPEFAIIKTTNAAENNGTFAFEYSFVESGTNVTDSGYVEITTLGGIGEETIIGFLPRNFTGIVTVKETHVVSQTLAQTEWILDTGEKTLEFVDGICTIASHAVTFANSLFKPDISLSKEHNAASAVDRGAQVTYTLTLINTGDEMLTDVEVVDSMFKADTLFDSVVRGGVELSKGVGYSYIGETLTIDELGKGEIVLIVYTITFDISGTFENEAQTKAFGLETKLEVSAKADERVIVRGSNNGGGTYTPPRQRPIVTPVEPVEEEEELVEILQQELPQVERPSLPDNEEPPIEEPADPTPLPDPEPDETVEIGNPIVPTINLPRTGQPDVMPIFMLVLGAVSICVGLLITGKRRD